MPVLLHPTQRGRFRTDTGSAMRRINCINLNFFIWHLTNKQVCQIKKKQNFCNKKSEEIFSTFVTQEIEIIRNRSLSAERTARSGYQALQALAARTAPKKPAVHTASVQHHYFPVFCCQETHRYRQPNIHRTPSCHLSPCNYPALIYH